MRWPLRRKYSWDEVITIILTQPKHKDILVNDWEVPDLPPEFEERLGDEDGQVADYGLALDDGTGIHVKKYNGYYKIHWDKKDPNDDPLGHLVYDAPHWLAIGALAADWIFLKGKYTKKLLNFISSI